MNKKKTERTFKPGNNYGRLPIGDVPRLQRIRMQEQQIEWVYECRNATDKELNKILKDPDASIGKKLVAFGYKKRKIEWVKYFEDKAIGKAREIVDIEGGVLTRIEYVPVSNKD